jgi:hypothetical protein
MVLNHRLQESSPKSPLLNLVSRPHCRTFRPSGKSFQAFLVRPLCVLVKTRMEGTKCKNYVWFIIIGTTDGFVLLPLLHYSWQNVKGLVFLLLHANTPTVDVKCLTCSKFRVACFMTDIIRIKLTARCLPLKRQ